MGKLHQPLEERFFKYVRKTPSCWEWTGARSSDGYGAFQMPTKLLRAHRASWLLKYGYMPDVHVCHTCDNPICVKPDHLFLGTHQDNMADMTRKKRRHKYYTHCPKGHEFSKENTYTNSRGHRFCKKCRAICEGKRRANKKL